MNTLTIPLVIVQQFVKLFLFPCSSFIRKFLHVAFFLKGFSFSLFSQVDLDSLVETSYWEWQAEKHPKRFRSTLCPYLQPCSWISQKKLSNKAFLWRKSLMRVIWAQVRRKISIYLPSEFFSFFFSTLCEVERTLQSQSWCLALLARIERVQKGLRIKRINSQ